jgi:uncharacterized glyoxalase superfamily protein PhnB
MRSSMAGLGLRTGDSVATRLVLAIRYQDVAAAIDWLCTALGFREHDVVPAEDGTIARAQLTFGNDIVILLPARGVDDTSPARWRGGNRQSCYFVVDDADAHYRTAKAAGADIVLDIGDLDQDGRGYSCRDPEGQVWSFGTFDPWQVRPLLAHGRALKATAGRAFSTPVLLGAMLVAAVVSSALMWMAVSLLQAGKEKRMAVAAAIERTEEARAGNGDKEEEIAARSALQQLARERAAKESAERAAQDAAKQLANAQSAKDAAERAVQEALKQVTLERSAKEAAEQATHEPVKSLTREREAKEAAWRALQAALDEAARERAAKDAAERVSQNTLEELARERSAREAAEHAAREAHKRLAKPARKTVGAEPAGGRRQPKEPGEASQVWECMPLPPNGQVICYPSLLGDTK